MTVHGAIKDTDFQGAVVVDGDGEVTTGPVDSAPSRRQQSSPPSMNDGIAVEGVQIVAARDLVWPRADCPRRRRPSATGHRGTPRRWRVRPVWNWTVIAVEHQGAESDDAPPAGACTCSRMEHPLLLSSLQERASWITGARGFNAYTHAEGSTQDSGQHRLLSPRSFLIPQPRISHYSNRGR